MFTLTGRHMHRVTAKPRLWLVAVVTLLIVIQASAVWADTPTTVTFWHSLGGFHQETLNPIIDQFNADNPDVVVRAEFQGNHGDLQQKLIAAVAAKRPPTMSLVFNNWTAAFVDGNTITPVSQFIDHATDGLSATDVADYVPAFVEANSWNDRWTTMPFSKSIYVLYYNEDLLTEAGVGVPNTMNELRAAAKAVTEKTDAMGLALQADNDQFGIFLHAFGGSWIDADVQSAFNDQSGVNALQFLHDLVHIDKSTYYHDGYLDDEFNAGKTAMFFATVATIPWLSAEHHAWGAAPVPEGTVQAAPVSGQDIAIFSQADEQAQKAAWRFIKFLTSPEINAEWAIASGYLPVRQSAVNTEAYQAHIDSAPEKYSAGADQLLNAKFDPGLSAWFEAREFITHAVEKVLIQRTSAKAALDEAAKQTNRALAD